jgi:hypothetical protein
MLHRPETFMRGQPDLLFWRIDTHNLDTESDTHSNGRDDEKCYDGGVYNNDDNNKNNNINDDNDDNDDNENNNDCYKNDDARSNNKNDNCRSDYNYRSNTNNNIKTNANTNTNIDIITTHTVFAVEVKSSTDQLSEWQIAWFNLLNHAGLHVENFQVSDA